MIDKALGIVLRQIKYGETGLIVHLYTNRWGRMGIMVPGARTSSKSRKAHLFQPLTLLEMEVYFKPGRELQNIREVRNHNPFIHLYGDPVKSAVALFLSDILNKALREEEPNGELFEFLSSHIQLLDVLDEGVANFHLYFLLRLSRYLGFYPGIPPEGQDLWFDLAHGDFSGSALLQGPSLPPDMTALLIRLLCTRASDLSTLSIDRQTRNRLLDALLLYYRLHLEGLGEIKSHAVLQALFD